MADAKLENPRSTEALRVALFGGSFNPPHLAHALVVAWALAGGEVDEVWAIPTNGHPFGKPLAPFADRLEMCRLAFGFSGRVRVLDVECEPRVHYSIDTIRRLAGGYPECRWRWLMGSDATVDAPKWKDFAEIERLAPPLVIPRKGHGAGAGPARAFALPDVSSTMIREHLAAGQPAKELEGLLPAGVIAYLETRKLY